MRWLAILLLASAGLVHGAVNWTNANIVFDGDSLWERNGSFAAAPNRISEYVVAYAAGAVEANYGVGGQRWDQMQADAAAQVDSLLVAGKTNILHCGSGVNEWEQGYLPAIGYSNAVVYLRARKAAGWHLVVSTIPNCYFSGRSDTYWTEYNALIRADSSNVVYSIVDVGADFAFTNYTDSTYRLDAGSEPCAPCRVHYKDAAIRRWALLSDPVLASFLPATDNTNQFRGRAEFRGRATIP